MFPENQGVVYAAVRQALGALNPPCLEVLRKEEEGGRRAGQTAPEFCCWSDCHLLAYTGGTSRPLAHVGLKTIVDSHQACVSFLSVAEIGDEECTLSFLDPFVPYKTGFGALQERSLLQSLESQAFDFEEASAEAVISVISTSLEPVFANVEKALQQCESLTGGAALPDVDVAASAYIAAFATILAQGVSRLSVVGERT